MREPNGSRGASKYHPPDSNIGPMGAHPEGKNFWGAHRNPGGPVSAEERKKTLARGSSTGVTPASNSGRGKNSQPRGCPREGPHPPKHNRRRKSARAQTVSVMQQHLNSGCTRDLYQGVVSARSPLRVHFSFQASMATFRLWKPRKSHVNFKIQSVTVKGSL